MPTRLLPRGGRSWAWRWRAPTASRPWRWCRVYHRGVHTPTGETARGYGPLYRFDPHTPSATAPADDPAGRTVLYAGADLATSACEVFGAAEEATLCPNYRVGLLRPTAPLRVFDLTAPGAALAIGALPKLADGDHPRALTQQWARAIYEDDPTGGHVDGIRYRSAYHSGVSLALWDTGARIQTVRDRSGTLQDFSLRSAPMYARLVYAMEQRHIVITLADAADCAYCP